MGYIVSELMLVFHFALIFSLALLCSVLFIRTRDRLIAGFLKLLIPLFLYLLVVLVYYLNGPELQNFFGSAAPAASLLSLVFVSLLIPLVVYGTTGYMLSLLDISDRERKIGKLLLQFFSLILFIFSLFVIIYLNGSDWTAALSRALNELFLYGSLFLVLPAIVSTIFLKRNRDEKTKRLLSDIMISFYPMPAFFLVDIFLFTDLPYKLAYLSYSTFSLLIYFYISRHYFHYYEREGAEKSPLPENLLLDKNISDREKEIIDLLIEGKSNREIGDVLFISYNTVKTHIRNIYRKLEVSSKLQLLYVIRNHPEG